MSRGFRVWDEQTKNYEWDREFVLDSNGELMVMVLYSNHNGTWEYHFADTDRCIVELDTGLKDKNGKEIYEGDIVEWVNGLGEKHIFEIMWNECRASFQMVEIGQEYPYILQGLSDKMKPYCEVIGNIHEPPKDFRPEHLKRMGVSISKGGEE